MTSTKPFGMLIEAWGVGRALAPIAEIADIAHDLQGSEEAAAEGGWLHDR